MTAAALHAVPARPRVSGDDGKNVFSLYDDLRENRINALARLLNQAMQAGDRWEAYRIQKEWKAAIDARSPMKTWLIEEEDKARLRAQRKARRQGLKKGSSPQTAKKAFANIKRELDDIDPEDQTPF